MKSTGMWMSGMGIIGRHHGDCLPSRATTLRSPGWVPPSPRSFLQSLLLHDFFLLTTLTEQILPLSYLALNTAVFEITDLFHFN